MQGIIDLLRDYRRIFRKGGNGKIGRAELASAYTRLKIMESLNLKRDHERFLGFHVRFFNYTSLNFLVQEIFINSEYDVGIDRDDPLIIDCGSNVGLSILYFKKMYPSARIIGFEPDMRTFQVLKENVESNRLDGVTLHNKAVAGASGTIDFYCDADDPGSHDMSMFKSKGSRKCEAVEADTLSSYIREEVDLLKLDIEGAEQPVLEDLHRAGKLGLVRRIALEYHHHIVPGNDALSGMLKTLEENGFGYQFAALVERPVRTFQYQDVMVYAYRKK